MTGIRAICLVSLCALGCIFSMFHRSALAVLMPDISGALNLDSQQVGMLGALYLYAFALNQLPLGLLLARFGPRLIMALCLLLAALGALCLGIANQAWLAMLGRFFMGLGMSASFMGSLVFLAGWFPSNRFGLLSGLVAGAATLGGLLATTPLTWLAALLNWRGVFISLALATLFLAVAFWYLVTDPPAREKAPGLRQSLQLLLRRLSFWILGLASAARYGFFVAVQSTWIGPFLIWGMGLSQEQSAGLVFKLILGYMLGMPLSGFISDRLRARKAVIMVGLGGQALVALAMLFEPGGSLLDLMMICLGLFSAPGVLIYAHAKEMLPAQVVAPALTWINFFTILAGGLLTQLMGHWLPQSVSSVNNAALFNPLWISGMAALSLALFIYAFLPGGKR